MRLPARRRRSLTSQNLDSLLDTVANVVGVLIVMMAVTQLTVNHAMKRIQVWESEEAAELGEARAVAETKLAAIGPVNLLETLELALIREHIDRLRSEPSAIKVSEPARVAADVARMKLRARKLEQAEASKNEQLANLRILLSEVEARPEKAGIELRLPDPRPAQGEQVMFFCRYGRVLYPAFERLELELFEVTRIARGDFVRYFASHDVGNKDLRWRFVDTAAGQVARLDWRHEDAGETVAMLQAPESDFREALMHYAPGRRFARFYVWEDSFEVYLEARRIAEEAGFAAGWKPYPLGQSPIFSTSARLPPTPID